MEAIKIYDVTPDNKLFTLVSSALSLKGTYTLGINFFFFQLGAHNVSTSYQHNSLQI